MTANATPLISKNTPYGVFQVYTTDKAVAHYTFLQVTQVHSAEVVHYLTSHNPQEMSLIRADGMVFFKQDVQSLKPTFLIKTADCLPIFLGSTLGGAMLHAGWRGLQQKILQHDLVKKLRPDYAFFGPHICGDCYQVGPEFQEYFPGSPGLKMKNKHWYFSLQAEASFQIQETFGKIKMEYSELCTFCDKRLHSYRRGNNKQRNYNIFNPNL